MNGIVNPLANPLNLSSDLKLLFISLVISIAAITSVGFFTAQIESGFEEQAADLLAADVRINSDEKVPERISNKAKEFGLRVATTTEMPTMMMTKSGDMELVSLKAVSNTYPLRSHLKVTYDLSEKEQGVAVTAPKLKEIYISKRIAKQYNLSIKDVVSLGYQQFSISGFIDYEPDNVGNVFQFAPKVIINSSDLDSTRLILPGSRVKYHLLLAGDKIRLEDMISNGDLLCPKCKLETVKDAQPQIRKTIERAADFLQLAVLVSIILAGAAMVMSIQQYAQNQVKNSVIMRSMGATMANVINQELVLLGQLTLMASAVGSSIGYMGSLYLQSVMDGLIAVQGISLIKPIVSGLLTALVMVIGFTLPTLLALKNVTVIEVLQQQTTTLNYSSWKIVFTAFLSLMLILLWNSQDYKLTAVLFAALSVSLLFIYSLVLAVSFLISKTSWVKDGVYVGWQMGLVLFTKRKYKNALQITSLAIGILVVVLLALLNGDILSMWQSSMSKDTANTFLINIQTDDVKPVQEALKTKKIDAKFSPMIRARLVQINDKQVLPDDYEDLRAQRLLNREFNISYTNIQPVANKIVEGKWWDKPGTAELSLEEGIAKTLGLNINDKLKFDIAGKTVIATITNIRSLKWQSLNVNFFVIVNKGGWIENFPRTWISSFYVSEQNQIVLRDILAEYSHITMIDINALMARIQGIISKVSQALEFVFLYTFASALLVLFAAANSIKNERANEIALQKVFGSNKKQLGQSLMMEYGLIALLSALPASIVAWIVGNYLLAEFFSLPETLGTNVLLLYIPVAIVMVMLSGWFANNKVMKTLPQQFLK